MRFLKYLPMLISLAKAVEDYEVLRKQGVPRGDAILAAVEKAGLFPAG